MTALRAAWDAATLDERRELLEWIWWHLPLDSPEWDGWRKTPGTVGYGGALIGLLQQPQQTFETSTATVLVPPSSRPMVRCDWCNYATDDLSQAGERCGMIGPDRERCRGRMIGEGPPP